MVNTDVNINVRNPYQLEIGEESTSEMAKQNTCSRIVEIFKHCKKFWYDHTSPLARNLIRVAFAGGLSTIGGIMAGDPRIVAILGIWAIYLGAITGGIGNGASTYLMWETDLDDRVRRLEELVEVLQDVEKGNQSESNLE